MYGHDLPYLSGFVRLSVPDVGAATDWYSAALGFAPIAGGIDGGHTWRHLRRGEGQDLVLVATVGRGRLRARATLASAGARLGLGPAGPVPCLAVDRDPGAVAAEARRDGARVEPVDGGAAVAVTDPFGNSWLLFAREPAPRVSSPPPKAKGRTTALARRRARKRGWEARP